jgi:hypothetical protein
MFATKCATPVYKPSEKARLNRNEENVSGKTISATKIYAKKNNTRNGCFVTHWFSVRLGTFAVASSDAQLSVNSRVRYIFPYSRNSGFSGLLGTCLELCGGFNQRALPSSASNWSVCNATVHSLRAAGKKFNVFTGMG